MEALLMLQHPREMDERDMASATEFAQELYEQLEKSSTRIQALYIIFHLPLVTICIYRLLHGDSVRLENTNGLFILFVTIFGVGFVLLTLLVMLLAVSL